MLVTQRPVDSILMPSQGLTKGVSQLCILWQQRSGRGLCDCWNWCNACSAASDFGTLMQIAREKAVADELRKKAKSMAQQVAAFWSKAHRVVATKVRGGPVGR